MADRVHFRAVRPATRTADGGVVVAPPAVTGRTTSRQLQTKLREHGAFSLRALTVAEPYTHHMRIGSDDYLVRLERDGQPFDPTQAPQS